MADLKAFSMVATTADETVYCWVASTVGDSAAAMAVQKADWWVDGKAGEKVGWLAVWWVAVMVWLQVAQ